MNILAIHGPQIGGCEYHRIIGPMGHLAKHHGDLNITWGADLADYRMADLLPFHAVVLHRTITSIPSLFEVVKHQLQQVPQLRIIIDTDDHYQLPENDPRHQEWTEYGISDMIKLSWTMAHEVWTTTQTLAEKVRSINPNVVQIPNAIDTQLAMWRVAPGKIQSNRYRIGIFCQPTHWQNIQLLKTGLRRVLANNSDVDIVAIGVNKGHQNFVRHHLGLTIKDPVIFRDRLPVDEYADHYRNIDILLAPLQQDEFNAMRSPLKLWEAAASQTPIIAQDFGPYAVNVKGIKRVKEWDNLHKHIRRHREVIPVTKLTPTYAECQAMRYQRLTEK